MSKVQSLLDAEGMKESEFLEAFAFDSVIPGICMTEGCDYTSDVEPDQDRGWCEECNKPTVKCGLMLMIGF